MVLDDNGPSLVELTPLRFKFDPPYGQSIVQTATLNNLMPHCIAFKMQTNRPQFYKVLPNKGVIKADESMEIQFELTEHLNKTTFLGETKPHRFRIYACKWPEDTLFDMKIWNWREDTNKDHFMQLIEREVDLDYTNPTFFDGLPAVESFTDMAARPTPTILPPRINIVQRVTAHGDITVSLDQSTKQVYVSIPERFACVIVFVVVSLFLYVVNSL